MNLQVGSMKIVFANGAVSVILPLEKHEFILNFSTNEQQNIRFSVKLFLMNKAGENS